jgi:hypothetical protein
METGEPLIIHGMGFRVKNYSQTAGGVVCRQAFTTIDLIIRQFNAAKPATPPLRAGA